MIRIFQYKKKKKYKDFENYVFTNFDKRYFDIPNDKVTLGEKDYRLSSIVVLGAELPQTGQAELPIIDTDFDSFIELMYFSNLKTLTRYRFTHDITGKGEQQYIFLADSINSAEGNFGIEISLTIDGRILMNYFDKNNDIIPVEIPITFVASNDPETYIFEVGGIGDNLIFN